MQTKLRSGPGSRVGFKRFITPGRTVPIQGLVLSLMASNLRAMAPQAPPNSDGLQPKSDGSNPSDPSDSRRTVTVCARSSMPCAFGACWRSRSAGAVLRRRTRCTNRSRFGSRVCSEEIRREQISDQMSSGQNFHATIWSEVI